MAHIPSRERKASTAVKVRKKGEEGKKNDDVNGRKRREEAAEYVTQGIDRMTGHGHGLPKEVQEDDEIAQNVETATTISQEDADTMTKTLATQPQEETTETGEMPTPGNARLSMTRRREEREMNLAMTAEGAEVTIGEAIRLTREITETDGDAREAIRGAETATRWQLSFCRLFLDRVSSLYKRTTCCFAKVKTREQYTTHVTKLHATTMLSLGRACPNTDAQHTSGAVNSSSKGVESVLVLARPCNLCS